jgi:cullin-associated NEDD8-dissociated protein 1
MHSGLSMSLPKQLGFVDHAMKSFREEMQAQGMWEQVVVVQGSEFGRTLTSNGDGTDHAWGGNYFVAGGAVRGGRILGQFPADLTEAGPQSVGRGRLLPTAAWEHTWNAVAQVSSH